MSPEEYPSLNPVEESDTPRMAVLTAFDQTMAGLGRYAGPNRRRYCGQHGYDYGAAEPGHDSGRRIG